jgi:large subunit ribosomal protein L21
MEQKTRAQSKENASVPSFERYAIIQTGGKQYQAIEGKTLAIEKIDGEAGTQLEFDVLLRKMGPGEIQIGQPTLPTKVKASIIKQMKSPKVIVFKFKRRKKSRVKKGHRQPMTVVRIEAI